MTLKTLSIILAVGWMSVDGRKYLKSLEEILVSKYLILFEFFSMSENVTKYLKENLQAAMGWMSVDGRGLAVPAPNQVSISIIAIIIVIIIVDGDACFKPGFFIIHFYRTQGPS